MYTILWQRSIPACAGEPPAVPEGAGAPWVYPRVCGGTLAVLGEPSTGIGLSPRVRGNHDYHHRHHRPARSIPACAGEPARAEGRRLLCGVYPRVCGGTPPRRNRRNPAQGLSPRVRGNPGRQPTPRVPGGSIPACAGNPCGINRRSAQSGSIPACAGEPYHRGYDRQLPAVYPRVCGGTNTDQTATNNVQGLSPRVRGNRAGALRLRRLRRSIPACAGEPV